MEKLWKVAISITGLAGVGAFVFWSLYKKWLSLEIFSKLNENQTFIIAIIFLIITFLALVLILITYLKSEKIPDKHVYESSTSEELATVVSENIIKFTVEELDKKKGKQFVEKELYKIICRLPKKKRFYKAIIFLDIDELTIINKKFGQYVGDEVLSIVGGLVKSKVSINYFGRCGDDTFYAVLMNSKGDKTMHICQKLRNKIQNFQWHKIAPELRVTCTFGFAILSPNESPYDWIKRSALGMLEGKKQGGNTVNEGPKFAGKEYIPKRKDLTQKEIEELYYNREINLGGFWS